MAYGAFGSAAGQKAFQNAAGRRVDKKTSSRIYPYWGFKSKKLPLKPELKLRQKTDRDNPTFKKKTKPVPMPNVYRKKSSGNIKA